MEKLNREIFSLENFFGIYDEVEEIVSGEDEILRRVSYMKYLMKRERIRKLRASIYIAIIAISIGVGTLL